MLRPSTDSPRLRALRILADSPEGHTITIMMVHGFSAELLSDLIKTELVTARQESITRGEHISDVVRLRITEMGQETLGGGRARKPDDPLQRALRSAKVALLNRSDQCFEQLAVAALADIDAVLHVPSKRR